MKRNLEKCEKIFTKFERKNNEKRGIKRCGRREEKPNMVNQRMSQDVERDTRAESSGALNLESWGLERGDCRGPLGD